MARLPRLALAGELHLLLLRGHNDQPVFADDADRATFCALLHDAASRYGIALHAYALLTNQVHLLLTPAQSEAPGRLVQTLGRRYVAAVNRRHGRRGTLWDGRFRSSLVDAGTLLLAATVFVETRPVAAGLVASASEYPWSSAAHHVGLRRDPLVRDHDAYWQLGNTPFDRERAHTLALQDDSEPRFLDAEKRALVFGPPSYQARVADTLSRPVHPRPRGRPAKHSKSVPIYGGTTIKPQN
jgi:putative transposase